MLVVAFCSVPNGFCLSAVPIVRHPSSFRLVPNEHTVGNAHEGGRSGGRKRALRKKHLPSRPSGSSRTRKHDIRVRAHEGGSSGGRKRARRRKRAGGWRAFRLILPARPGRRSTGGVSAQEGGGAFHLILPARPERRSAGGVRAHKGGSAHEGGSSEDESAPEEGSAPEEEVPSVSSRTKKLQRSEIARRRERAQRREL